MDKKNSIKKRKKHMPGTRNPMNGPVMSVIVNTCKLFV